MGRANIYFVIVKHDVQIFCTRVNILGIVSGSGGGVGGVGGGSGDGGGGRKVIKQHCIDKLWGLLAFRGGRMRGFNDFSANVYTATVFSKPYQVFNFWV